MIKEQRLSFRCRTAISESLTRALTSQAPHRIPCIGHKDIKVNLWAAHRGLALSHSAHSAFGHIEEQLLGIERQDHDGVLRPICRG